MLVVWWQGGSWEGSCWQEGQLAILMSLVFYIQERTVNLRSQVLSFVSHSHMHASQNVKMPAVSKILRRSTYAQSEHVPGVELLAQTHTHLREWQTAAF